MEYRAVIRSELKQKILLSLLNGAKRLSELKEEIDSTETTILHALKEFEKNQLTTKNAGVYSLSSLGVLEAQMCEGCCRATEAMEKFREFWLSHDVKPIPESLMLKLGMLRESAIVRSGTSELGKVHETFIKMMQNTRYVVGTSPIFHPDFVDSFKAVLNSGGTIELILTSEVLNRTFEYTVSNGDSDLFGKYMAEGHLKIYLIDDLKIALTVTEHLFSMGLFNLNKKYDYSMDLISTDPEALEWGEQVFREYLKQSKPIEM